MKTKPRSRRLFNLAMAFMLALGSLTALVPAHPISAAGTLEINIIAGYNLVVDSNVTSPSTYAPRVATVIGEFCNTGADPLTDVYGYIGDYDGATSTPGTYPARNSLSDGFQTGEQWNYLYDTGSYFFRHVGAASDATRYMDEIPAGECRYQYWTIEYPACENVGGAWAEPPCTGDPTWGPSVKPDDDLSLEFDVWGTGYDASTPRTDNTSWTMTMRNEISAMANKIEPNGNPAGRWFNTEDDTVRVGDVITTNGVLYSLGNIRSGFDNDGDFLPDYNAWLQPISQANYDPTCFRLIRTTGTLTVTRGSGNPDMHINFTNQLYFTNLPPDNTNVRGVVYYTFMALDGPCNVALSPYQEVASGFDNEKFNGDYGTGIPPILSLAPEVTLDKTSTPDTLNLGQTTTYRIPFANIGTADAGLTLSTGYGLNMPLVIEDTVPVGMQYEGGTATASLAYTPNSGVTILYSKDGGATWSTTDPGDTLSSTGSEVVIQWRLNDRLPAGSTGNYAEFQTTVPGTYAGASFIENEACISLGDADPFACADALTLVRGTNSLGDFIWQDEDGDGNQDGGSAEPGLNGVTVKLYWDSNNNGSLDAGDPLIEQTASQGATITDGLLSGFGGDTFAGYTIIGGRVDVNGDGSITTADDGTSLIGGYNTTTNAVVLYNVVDGYVDVSGNGTIGAEDDGALSGNYGFAYLPNGRYIVQVAADDTDITTGYTPTTLKQYAVNLSAGGVNNRTSDFGFGPTLVVLKGLASDAMAYVEDEDVTFVIDLLNTLPGDGTASGFCRYTIWATAAGTHNSGSGWTNNTNAYSNVHGPDEAYAELLPATNADILSAGGFGLNLPSTANILKVEAIYSLYIDNVFSADDLQTRFWKGAVQYTSENIPFTTINAYGPGQSNKGLYIWDVTTGYGTWALSDFNSTTLEVGFYAKKSAQGDTILNLDALGFRVTTDQLCGGADTTIATLPVTDNYDADLLQFLYADPPASSHTTSGASPNTVGTITWDNVGPLYAGGTNRITVTFKALATTPSTINAAEVTGAKFGNGRDVNDDDDDASVGITASGSIAGTIWADSGTSNGWTSPTGYDTLGDTRLSGVTVNLYGCYFIGTEVLALPSTVKSTGKPCTDSGNGGEWRLMESQITDASGAYLFDALHDGYYDVRVDTTTLPAGFTTNRAEPSLAANGAGFTCSGTCDNQWNADENLNQLNNIDNSSGGEDITNVSFGYVNASNLGAVVGYVWQDDNGDGVWDSSEQPIPGVTVYLCPSTTDPCDTSAITAVTDETGQYVFSNVTPGSYRTGVETDDLPGMSQSGDPDGTLDNQTTTAFTVSANAISGPYNYGYTGGLALGDTVYIDWDGDGTQDAGEDGISGVQISVYRDSNGNGSYDLGIDVLVRTVTTLDYNVVDGYIDVDGDGTANESTEDLSDLHGIAVIDGALDLNGDGSITGDDDGWFAGIRVVDGRLDMDDDLGIDADDDGSLLGRYQVPFLPGNGNDYFIRVNPSTIPVEYVQTADPDATLDSRTTSTLNDSNVWTVDFGYQPQATGIIGDTVWIDTDSDGTQDAGESGQPNVTVYLYRDTDGDGIIDAADDALIAATTTLGYAVVDGYIDVDGDGTPNETTEDLADLYGYAIIDGAIDIDGNGVIGATDDGTFGPYRVVNGRLDMDGDGDGDTNDDGDLYGFYIFQDLPAGDFIVQVAASEFSSGGDLEGYTLTNTASAYNATQVSREVTLAEAQVFYDADFGFVGGGAIGDRIWQDNNGNGNQDLGEPGIENVTVGLYTWTDVDDDGVYDASVDTISATPIDTDVTDSDGLYLFTSVPAGDYVVLVDDTSLPTGFTQTGDPDWLEPCTGALCDGASGATLKPGQTDLSRDFGYQPPGVIGDYIWFDADGDGMQDDGESGIGSVTVYLCDPDDSCDSSHYIAKTETDSDGYYTFGALAGGDYDVKVEATTLPTGVAITYDLDSGTSSPDGITAVTLSSGGSNLTADFGYRYYDASGYAISGTVFFDAGSTGDGTSDIYAGSGTDTPYAGITIYLWSGGKIIGETTTDANGYYSFGNLPNGGTYTVSVDRSGNLGAMLLTATPNAGNSFNTVTLAGGNVIEQDFGFYARMDMGDLPISYDFGSGDNPTGYYTPFSKEGPMHVGPASGDPTIFLGSSWDAEPDGAPDTDAGVTPDSGDDNAAGSDDEDGIVFLTPWYRGQTAQLQITVTDTDGTYNPYVAGWFDWNRNGQFDTDELVVFDDLGSGANTKPLPIPSDAGLGRIYMRFRIYATQSPPPVLSPIGAVQNGEVEDYWKDNEQPTAVTLAGVSAIGRGWNLPALGMLALSSLALVLPRRKRRSASEV